MKFSQNITQNGIIGGIAAVFYTFALYFIDAGLLFNFLWATLPFLIIFPLFMTLSALGDRKDNNGYLSIVEAFKSAFFAGIIALSISTLFSFALQKFIDPSLEKVAEVKGKENAYAFGEKMTVYLTGEGMTDEQIEQIEEDFENRNFSPKLSETIFFLIISGAFGALPALIIGRFVRRKEDILDKYAENA